MNPAEVIRKCAGTNSQSEKVAILKENDSEVLRFILKAAVSPHDVYGVKEFEFAEPLNHDDFEVNWKFVPFAINKLRGRLPEARKFIAEVSNNLNTDQQEALTWILQKDLRAGIGSKTVNKAFKGLIPEHRIQKGKKISLGKVVYPVYVEKKFNGERNTAIVVGGRVTHLSSNGKEKKNWNFLNEELLEIAGNQDLVFDGEVCGIHADNKMQRRAVQQQSNRKGNVDTSKLMFCVWEILPLGAWKLRQVHVPLFQRRQQMASRFFRYMERTEREKFNVRLAKAKVCSEQDELFAYYNKVVEEGGEGVMVKNAQGYYTFKRDDNWMKLKPEETGDFEIVDVVEGKKGRKGTLGSVVVDVEGNRVRCGIGGGITIDMCREWWKEPDILVGKTAEVQYLDMTLDGSLLSGKLIDIREDK